MQSRFMRNNINPTILVLASSKRTEQSFMETWIENKKKQESKTVRVVDEPQWVIRPDKQSKETFKIAIGNKFLDSEVLPLSAPEQLLDVYRARGYTLLDVPMGYYENFLDDINIALTDIAGISTSNVSRYMSGPRIAAIKKPELKNLIMKEILEVGNGPDDKIQYYDFIDPNILDNLGEIKYKPLYIHLDMSLSGDKTGIAGVWIVGKKPTEPGKPPNKDLSYRLAFSFSVKAPKGYQVSFEKNRNFIRWLKQVGFNIKGISSDTFQSADLIQSLSSEGFNTTIISVDRVDSASRTCIPYLTFRNAIYEERLSMYDNKLLTDELLGLERDSNGKIDHSPNGINSKDQADAVCGALYNASQHAEEYAYEFGEDLKSVVEANEDKDLTNLQQLTVDFEEELKKIQDPLRRQTEQVVNTFNNYGFGRATSNFSTPYNSNDIIFI